MSVCRVFCVLSVTPDRSDSRDDHGLARDGWSTNNTRTTGRRPLEVVQLSMEWREASRNGICRAGSPQGRGSRAIVDHRSVLDGSIGRRVRTFLLIVRHLSPHPSARCTPSIYFLYALVRRPRLILDFALTLLFNHLVLTTYYAAAVPTSLFFWLVMGVSTAGTIVFAEQLCVKREMNEGLVVASVQDAEDSVEMGSLLRED